jgi:protein-L-isoaspartate(D-aspartate) O-methyltransferase
MLKPAALTGGLRSEGPYDVILLNGSTEIVPEALIRQLKDGGRLVCIQGSGPSGKATLYQMTGGNVTGHAIFDAAAPLLPGFVKPREFVF